MDTLQSTNYKIEIGSLIDSSFSFLISTKYKKSKKIIIVDENTKEFCLDYLITSFNDLAFAEIIELSAGEEYKQLDICIQVWESLTEYHIDRNALIINLGGGVISDMGGLIASLYKRGIDFINIPTTLLAMIDASVGGKTGVDLGSYKNQIGIFSFPKSVYIDLCFLKTLDELQIKNGYAEMIKHGLITDKNHWINLKKSISNKEGLTIDLIKKSVDIKNQIVIIDPFELNERKKLNFGHTIGHAIESYFLSINKPILHGFAVAAGIKIESYISYLMNFIDQSEYEEIKQLIDQNYSKLDFTKDEIDKMVSYTRHDKKNNSGQIKMVLLKSIGQSIYDIAVNEEIIRRGLIDYVES